MGIAFLKFPSHISSKPQTIMNPTIIKIKEKLDNFQNMILQRDPCSEYRIKILEEKENSIIIQPQGENTFPLTLIADADKYDVYFQGWHEKFTNEADALDCFAFGLSDYCRLKVISVGDVEYKWILEVKEKGKWVEDSETGIALFPFWQKKVITYLQNKIVRGEK